MSKTTALNILPKIFIVILFSTVFLSCNNHKVNKKAFKEQDEEEREGPREAHERDVEMMKDPVLGYIPNDRLLKAKQYRDELWQSHTNAVLPGVSWHTLGPKNQGGRTRSLLIDANDATGNTVWAGSVGGGLWKTTDITAAEPDWAATDDFFGNLAVSSIVQDPSNPLVMYFCTGEQGYNNADATRGLGVWKSTNGGTTWAQLASTNNATFSNNEKMAVNNTGIVFVSTSANGLQRSANGGTTWTKVLGTGLGITGAASNLSYDVEVAANGDIYATLAGSIHKSTDAGLTFAAAQTLPITATRIEVACAPNDANYVYALIENGNVVNGIIRTVNAGTTWTSRTEPADADPGIPAADFSRTQAWYDLTIAVDPNNKDALMVGGVDLFKSTDGAGSWTQISHWYGGFGFTYAHADQHYIIYKPGSSSIAYFTNDGGVFRTANANAATPIIQDKGTNYVTAQFYACAMHPTSLTNYYLAGAQDNGSHQFTQGVVQNTSQVTGGDGAYVHIDQNEPQYQFTSYVYNNYYRSADAGATWTSVSSGNTGRFINPTDYDDTNNKMYCAKGTNEYLRWDNPQTGGTFTTITVAAFGGQVSCVTVSPNTANRVFFGANGDVFRVDNANTGAPAATNISSGLPASYLNCIEVETGNDSHLLAVYSNFGVNSIWESTDAGVTWISVEGNLPDMPIRWALFNPNNSDQVIVATDLGVWSTDNLNAASTVWGASNSGLANVRVDMLQVRSSDKLVTAATHGRGLFYSDIFTNPTALFSADRLISYIGVPLQFTSSSYKGTSWSWNFGDPGSGVLNTSASENPTHAFSAAGQYSVTLTINGGAATITKNLYIQILPNKGTPYTLAQGGNFESNQLDFGADYFAGTPWQRGNSAIAGKNGTNSGSNAWVTGLAASTYADNGEASLMTPNFNFGAGGAYLLRFRAKYNVETDYDGFRVEYTLDSGRSWIALGTALQGGWYNNANTAGTTSFPANEAFFSGISSVFTTYFFDPSLLLAGRTSVAFRFRFRSDVNTNAAGAALDDFEIIGPFNTPLAVNLVNFAAIKKDNNALINWKTENEVDINNYVLERSYDGINFSPISSLIAKNGPLNSYNYSDLNVVINAGTSKYIFYRLKITDKTAKIKYSEIAKISLDKSAPQITIGPNVFTSFVSVYTNEIIKQVLVYDIDGKLVYQTSNIIGNKIMLANNLPKGMYLFKLFTNSSVVTRRLIKG
jgi:PKD repeat protein